MKIYAIALVLLPFSTLISKSNPSVPKTIYAASDTVKKAPTSAEMKKMKKDLNKSLPKGMSDMVVNMVKDAGEMDLDESPVAMTKMNYVIEREEILNDFKNDSFDNLKEKREARKEMLKDLRELKKDYKKELRESREELREIKAELKDMTN
jgi:F0F1-type ATP synthase membrane subunit b/b'